MKGVDVRPGSGHPLRHRACPHDRHQAREHARWRPVRLRSRGPDGRVRDDAPPAGSRARAREAHRAGHAGLGAQGVRWTFRAEVFAGESLVHPWAVQVRWDHRGSMVCVCVLQSGRVLTCCYGHRLYFKEMGQSEYL